MRVAGLESGGTRCAFGRTQTPGSEPQETGKGRRERIDASRRTAAIPLRHSKAASPLSANAANGSRCIAVPPLTGLLAGRIVITHATAHGSGSATPVMRAHAASSMS